MFEHLLALHDSLWLPIRWALDFFVSTILLRGFLGNEILLEIRQRGWLKTGILHNMITKITSSEVVARKIAISQHYKHGHRHNEVVGCLEENCGLFTELAHTQAVTA